ncbi:MAG: lipopolysaccharide heptosyltransferase I [bacterium]
MKKILIIKPSSRGDIMHALPVATAISRQVPGAVIDWVVRPEYAEILEAHPAIRRIFLFDRGKWSRLSRMLKTLPEMISLVRSLRRENYDEVLDLQGLFRSGLLSFLSGSSLRFGFENAREFSPVFYNRKVKVLKERIHALERYQLFLKEMGLKMLDPDYGLKPSDDAFSFVENLLSKAGIRPDRPLIILNPNARWETKKWIAERWQELAKRLVTELQAEVIFAGGEAEASECDSLARGAGGLVHNLAGKTTLMQLAALLKKSSLLVTCDSGPMHLSVAVGTRVVALFGPTDPVRTGPYGSENRVLHKDMDCSPCLKRSCPERTHACMEAITVEEVFQEVKQMIVKLGSDTNS